MASSTPVQAIALPDVPRRLQQAMAKNRSKLEQAGIWEFLLWVRDVEKEVNEGMVTQFVQTYQLKTKFAQVGSKTVDFSTSALSQVLALPDGGEKLEALADLRKAEAEEIFDYKFKWGKETKWKFETARQHWKSWFEFVNVYLLFRPDEHKMEQKYVVAAIRIWEGKEVRWTKVVQERINEEIQVRKALAPSILYLYSAFYISCLCEDAGRKPEDTPPRPTSSVLPSSPPSPTLAEIEVQMAHTRLKMRELETQLSEKKNKLEEVQEKSAEYLQQINQLLQEKFSDHKRYEHLQAQNAALKLQLEEFRQGHGPIPDVPRGKSVTMVDGTSHTTPQEEKTIVPSMSKAPGEPEIAQATSKALALEVCTKLWAAKKKVIPNFNLHQFYVFQRDLFLAMVGLELEAWITNAQFQELWTFSVTCDVENLFAEILARKHLRLLEPFEAYIVLGDVGARIFLYYADCEEQLHIRRTIGRRVDEREADWSDYGTQMSQQFYGQSRETRAKWKKNLEDLLPMLRHEEYLA